jgi:hypothetical protein
VFHSLPADLVVGVWQINSTWQCQQFLSNNIISEYRLFNTYASVWKKEIAAPVIAVSG